MCCKGKTAFGSKALRRKHSLKATSGMAKIALGARNFRKRSVFGSKHFRVKDKKHWMKDVMVQTRWGENDKHLLEKIKKTYEFTGLTHRDIDDFLLKTSFT